MWDLRGRQEVSELYNKGLPILDFVIFVILFQHYFVITLVAFYFNKQYAESLKKTFKNLMSCR